MTLMNVTPSEKKWIQRISFLTALAFLCFGITGQIELSPPFIDYELVCPRWLGDGLPPLNRSGCIDVAVFQGKEFALFLLFIVVGCFLWLFWDQHKKS